MCPAKQSLRKKESSSLAFFPYKVPVHLIPLCLNLYCENSIPLIHQSSVLALSTFPTDLGSILRLYNPSFSGSCQGLDIHSVCLAMSEDAPTSVLLSPTPTRTSTATTTSPPTYERNGFLSTGSSPPAPQALLSSAAALSPGLPPSTTPPIPYKPPSPYNTEDPSIDLQRTPRARQQSSCTTSRLIPPESSSRPTSQTSFVSNASSSHVSSLNSPLCTPKVRDFAYPRTHKYHAPSFNHRRYSISSRSSTSSDLDSFFPQRIAGGPLYITDDDWKRGLEDEQHEGEEEEFIEVDGDEESVERRAVCVFDFTAECEGEISIEIGQVVWVEFRKGVSGWLVVRDEITGAPGVCRD